MDCVISLAVEEALGSARAPACVFVRVSSRSYPRKKNLGKRGGILWDEGGNSFGLETRKGNG